MSAHRVDKFNFEFWNGPPPALTYEQGSTFTRPGADGMGQQILGRWAEPFEVELVSWWSSYTAAALAVPLMQQIIRTGWVRVWHDNIDYLSVFSHGYFVDAVDLLRIQKCVRLLGPSINIASGAELVTRFKMTPHYLL